MEKLIFKYNGEKPISKPVHVGVVGSGNLEVIMEPSKGKVSIVTVRTRFDGFDEIWKAVLDKFFDSNNIMADIEINDFGATPGVVSIRLLQALEVSLDENNKK